MAWMITLIASTVHWISFKSQQSERFFLSQNQLYEIGPLLYSNLFEERINEAQHASLFAKQRHIFLHFNKTICIIGHTSNWANVLQTRLIQYTKSREKHRIVKIPSQHQHTIFVYISPNGGKSNANQNSVWCHLKSVAYVFIPMSTWFFVMNINLNYDFKSFDNEIKPHFFVALQHFAFDW